MGPVPVVEEPEPWNARRAARAAHCIGPLVKGLRVAVVTVRSFAFCVSFGTAEAVP
jgi:hypothetical protein